MRANDGGINEQVLHICVMGEALEQVLEDALFAPAGKAAIDGVPIAIVFGEQAPLRS
jgi:hypothetical protein